jgi:hypothetical protein
VASVIDGKKIILSYRLSAFMIKRLVVLTFCSAFICCSVVAQSLTESNFGTVPDSLFADDQYPADPNAPFIYSLKKLDVSFEEDEQSIIAVLKYHVRVKVFDSSVKEAAVVGIPYYFDNNIEQVSNIKGVTHQNGQVKVPLSPDRIRTININSRYNLKEFTMPAVRDGSVIEYRYTVRRRYIEELPDFYLAHQVPTSLAKVSITYPRYLRYKAVPENFSRPLNHTITQIDSSDVPKIFTYPQPDPLIRESWSAANIPAVTEEAYISSLDDYRSKIKFQLSEFGIPRQTLETSWDFIVAEIRRKQQILAKIDANNEAEKIGREISASFESKEAVQDSIFRYVNEKASFSGSEAPFSTVADQVVLRGEPSDQAAINQTLAAMLSGAGIEAHPVLISTRKSGMINTSFPSFFEFNGQLIHTEIGGKTYFMDASFPYSQPNLIPVDTYNETGLLLKPESYAWVDVEPAKSTFAIQIDMDATLQRNGTLAGTITSANGGYPAQQIREQNAEGQPTSQIIKKSVFDGYTDVAISGATISGLNNFDQPVTLSSDFSLDDYAASFSNGLDFRPMVVGYLKTSPFSENRRELPVTLDAPEKLDLRYTITLPQGYSIKQRPQNKIIKLPGATFIEQYKVEGQKITYEFHIEIFQKEFSTDLYPQLLNFYKRWVQLSNSRWIIER